MERLQKGNNPLFGKTKSDFSDFSDDTNCLTSHDAPGSPDSSVSNPAYMGSP